MSDRITLTDTLGDGVHDFKLPIAQLVELQEKTGFGPAALLSRMLDGSWRIVDLRETLRLSLIGGGMNAAAALEFVKRYVDTMTLNAMLAAATAVLIVRLNGSGLTDASADPDPAENFGAEAFGAGATGGN